MQRFCWVLLLCCTASLAQAIDGFVVYSQGKNTASFRENNQLAVSSILTWQVGICRSLNAPMVNLFASFETDTIIDGAVMNDQLFDANHPFVKDHTPELLPNVISRWQADVFFAGHKIGEIDTPIQSTSTVQSHCRDIESVRSVQPLLTKLVESNNDLEALSGVSLRNVKIDGISVPNRYFEQIDARYQSARERRLAEIERRSAPPIQQIASAARDEAPKVVSDPSGVTDPVEEAPNPAGENSTANEISPNAIQSSNPQSSNPMQPASSALPVSNPSRSIPVLSAQDMATDHNQTISIDAPQVNLPFALGIESLAILNGTDLALRARASRFTPSHANIALSTLTLAASRVATDRLQGDISQLVGLTTSGMDPWYYLVEKLEDKDSQTKDGNQIFSGVSLTTLKHLRRSSQQTLGATLGQHTSFAINPNGVNYQFKTDSATFSGASTIHLSIQQSLGLWWRPEQLPVDRLSVVTGIIGYHTYDDHSTFVWFGTPSGLKSRAGVPFPIDWLRFDAEKGAWQGAVTVGVTSPQWGLDIGYKF